VKLQYKFAEEKLIIISMFLAPEVKLVHVIGSALIMGARALVWGRCDCSLRDRP